MNNNSSSGEVKEEDNICINIASWLLQFICWALLLLSIYRFIEQNENYNDFLIVFIICYIIYFILLCFSKTAYYISNIKENQTIYNIMGNLFKKPPTITFHANCYHYEIHHYTTRDSKGRIHTTTKRIRVSTSTDNYTLPYYSVKDVSGKFLLKYYEASNLKKNYIKLYLKEEINFADSISYYDYNFEKEEFYRRNRYKDVYMDFKEERHIPGLKEYNLIKITNDKNICVNRFCFYLSTLLMMGQFYKILINFLSLKQGFKVRKLISTRYNLLEPEKIAQYQIFCPVLQINNITYNFEQNNTGFIYESKKVDLPTKEELERAAQYESMVPQYNIDNSEGQKGIVQDLPDFNEVYYNVPPPGFEQSGGNSDLPQSQMINTPPEYYPPNLGTNPNMNMGMNPNMNSGMNPYMNNGMNQYMNNNMNPNMNIGYQQIPQHMILNPQSNI